MTHQELVRTRPWVNLGKGKQRAWLAGGLAVAVAGTAIAATLAFRHPGVNPGGDPGRVRQQALRSISVALPGDAKVLSHSVGGPIWDSCDGRPDTQGWSDVINAYQFISAHSAATVVAGAEASMKIAGWKLSSTSHSPLGPSAGWTKTVSGNVVARCYSGSALVAPAGTAPPSGTSSLRRLQREHAHLAAEPTNAPAAWMNARIAADSAVASLLGVPVRLSLRLAEPRRTHRLELRWMLSRR
jgi:hypothetical protein